MGKKTGKQATYITFGGEEVKEIVKGHILGVSFNKTPSIQSHYTMIPKDLAGKGAKRSKLKWLGKDKENAISKFNAIIKKLRDEQEIYSDIPRHLTKAIDKPVALEAKVLSSDLTEITKGKNVNITMDMPFTQIPEIVHIEWLKKELLKPNELAKKTGIEAFNSFLDYVEHKPIKLSELYQNYVKSVKYKRIKDDDEKKKTEAAWNLFVSLIEKSHIDHITLNDIKKYETYLHSQDYSEKTIHHYKSRVSKIFRHNLKEFENTTRLQQILANFDKWEDLEINSMNSINAQIMDINDFNTLYDNASLELQAVLMLCLNTGTYIKEVARFKKSDIDFKQQTLMTKRNKMGQCRKCAYLWNRTIVDLKKYLETRKDENDILFISRYGHEYKKGQGLRTKFWALRDKTNLLNVQFNHLRDTFETTAKEIGIAEYHIDIVMGHSSGKTGDRYTHRRIHNELKKACLAVEKGSVHLTV